MVRDQNLRDTWNVFTESYIAADGLGKNEPEDLQPSFVPGGLETVKNQNGILTIAETMYLFDYHGFEIDYCKPAVLRTLELLRVPKTGCFDRNQGNKVFMDSHDNMVGIVWLCVRFGLNEMLEDILAWGEHNGWVFNNLDPANVSDVRALRLGPEIFVYKLAGGRVPYVLEWLWACGAFFWKPNLRLHALRRDIIRRSYLRWGRGVTALFVASLAWDLWGGLKRYFRIQSAYFQNPNHPIRLLLQLDGDQK